MDRRSFLARMLGGAFGLAAGQAVMVQAVESKIVPATAANLMSVGAGEVMIDTYRFPDVYLQSIAPQFVYRRLLGLGRQETRLYSGVDLSFGFGAPSEHTVTFTQQMMDMFQGKDRVEVLIRHIERR